MPKSEAELLLQKYKEGSCTPEEKLLVEEWFFSVGLDGSTPSVNDLNRMETEMWAEVRPEGRQKSGSTLWPRVAVAASILVLLAVSLILYQRQQVEHKKIQLVIADEIKPASDKAVLTLGNGTRILLDNLKTGDQVNQNGIKIKKTQEGQIIYEAAGKRNKDGQNTRSSVYNTITTPRGGQYQVVLPDATHVWLNAASSLTYPVRFNNDRRMVKLTGEAYFEVAKMFRSNASKHSKNKGGRLPFIVESAGQHVEVLGTHFNINAYQDEAAVKTTLFEGSVRVLQASTKNSVLLTPGHQAINKGSSLWSQQADADEAIAWKNGLFSFEDADLRTVMRQIARWYDLDVEYQGDIPAKAFSGEIHNNVKASQVLEILKYFQAKYVVEQTAGGKKILIKGIK